MTHAVAEVKGQQLVVRLPLWQLITIIGVGCSVVFSVWLTTRDLTREVGRLSNAVDGFAKDARDWKDKQELLDRRVWNLEQRTFGAGAR